MADPKSLARFGRGMLSKANETMEASGASSYLSAASSAASAAASSAAAAADAVLPDEVTGVMGEIGDAMSKRVKDVYSTFTSPGLKEFLMNPSPEELLLHPEYLTHSLKLFSAIKSPQGAALGLLAGGAMDVSKDRVSKAAAGQAGKHISDQTGGLVPASVVGNMSPSELQQAVKIMGKLGPML